MSQKTKKNRLFQTKKAVFVELLGGFEPPTSSLPSATGTFFYLFFALCGPIRSNPLTFRHSWELMFPSIPPLSVADCVVKPLGVLTSVI